MRVIAGKYRSRLLHSMHGMGLRPTSDKLRETLFNVVAPAIGDSVWLDVYAGTGAVGIEALSRGARMVHFIEASKRAAELLRKNLQSLNISAGFELLEGDAIQALRLLDSLAVVCDFCFLDPPYRMQEAYEEALGFLSQSHLLTPHSNVIVEHNKHFDPGGKFGALERHRELRQGDAVLSFYKIR